MLTIFFYASANCYYSGKYYDHGDAMSPKMCVTCTCDVSRMLYAWFIIGLMMSLHLLDSNKGSKEMCYDSAMKNWFAKRFKPHIP